MISILGAAGPNDARPVVLFDSLFWRAGAAIAASSTAAGSFAADIAGPQTFDWWKPATMPATLTLTLPAAEFADMFALVAHDMKSRGASLVLRYSPNLTTAFTDLAAVTPPDDGPLGLIFPSTFARRWQISVTGANAPALGVAMIGRRFSLPTAVTAPYVPLARARRVELLAGNSLGGQMFDARIKRGGGDARISFNPVPRAWADSDLRPFADAYDAGRPFFFGASPALAPDDLAYARRAARAGELRPAWRDGARWADLAFEVETYGA